MTNADDAQAAAALGADAVGMVLYAVGARRLVDADAARKIAVDLPPMVTAAGVVRDCPPGRMRQLTAHVPLGLVQFHGREPFQDVRMAQPVRATKVLVTDGTLAEQASQWAVARIPNLCGLHVDAAGGGGAGEPADWDEVASLDLAALPPVTLSGGLTPETVGEVVRRFRPWGVDVSTGVEGDDGRKSAGKMRAFVEAVRAADATADATAS